MIDLKAMSDDDLVELLTLGKLEMGRRKTATTANKALEKAAKARIKAATNAAKEAETKRHRVFNAKEAMRRGMQAEEAAHQFNVPVEELT